MKTLLFVGHSHIRCIDAARDLMPEMAAHIRTLFVRAEEFRKQDGSREPPHHIDAINREAFLAAFRERVAGADLVVMLFNGNEHNNVGMLKPVGLPSAVAEVEGRIVKALRDRQAAWFEVLRDNAPEGQAFALLNAPPPIEDHAHLLRTKAALMDIEGLEVTDDATRLAYYALQGRTLTEEAAALGLPLIELPADVVNARGFMADDCVGHDPSHGNDLYGLRVLTHVFRLDADALSARVPTPGLAHQVHRAPPAAPAPARRAAPAAGAEAGTRVPAPARPHPYVALPDHAFWRQGVEHAGPDGLLPLPPMPWKIAPGDLVATAGSCFAQHISKRLRSEGFAFLNAEPGPSSGSDAAQARGFHDFSARYGNVYTTRQLVQLFDRAQGFYRPADLAWQRPDGRWVDPFRPRVEPAGFASREEVRRDTQAHLMAVRQMFRQLDVFVFTLGLTECWLSRLDGAAYPLCPGTVAGEFDPRRHVFHNFRVSEVVADLEAFLQRLRQVNPRARLLLTVSPVPLVATMEPRHVLVSTTASKAILRAAVDEFTAAHPEVCYFPSYEIITGPQAAGRFFEPDFRSVRPEGVDQVMRTFMATLTDAPANRAAPAPHPGAATARSRAAPAAPASLYERLAAAGEAECDETALARD